MSCLAEQLWDARRRSLELVSDLTDEQLGIDRCASLNPFLWELGHIAWAYDALVCGYVDGAAPGIAAAEDLYNSFEVAHGDRWDLPLPDRTATLEYLECVTTAVVRGLLADPDSARRSYCVALAIRHEDMHGEAFTYARQCLGYPAPRSLDRVDADSGGRVENGSGALPGDVEVPGGRFLLGTEPGATAFVFDNEKWAHPVEVPTFRIARAPVTNAEFAAFVDAGGYEDPALWTRHGWSWRQRSAWAHPAYWSRAEDGSWLERHFDRVVPLPPDRPVTHVNSFEAEAWCRWAGRRLPDEAEWEMAASLEPRTGTKRRFPWGDAEPDPTRAHLDLCRLTTVDVADHPAGDSAVGCRQMLGNVWEWTSSRFYPYPGYVVDLPYREYSAPWFGDRMVLRGGAFPTRSRIAHNTYRNFFEPFRRDIYAGFRTCAR